MWIYTYCALVCLHSLSHVPPGRRVQMYLMSSVLSFRKSVLFRQKDEVLYVTCMAESLFSPRGIKHLRANMPNILLPPLKFFIAKFIIYSSLFGVQICVKIVCSSRQKEDYGLIKEIKIQ